MKRRQFIDRSAKLVFGVFLTSQFFVGCKQEELEKLIGKGKAELEDFDVEYEGRISCYSSKRFKHKLMDGGKVFIFCLENMVVGFSIKLEHNIPEKELVEQSGQHVLFDNMFGRKIAWEEEGRCKSICVPKKYNDIPQYFFYSEYMREAVDIIW